MKSKFKGFHNADQESLEKLWKDDKTIFVFDANVLLNLYGYAIKTRDDFFKILESISPRLWIPYQAGLEYQRRRLSVVRNEKKVFNEIENNLGKIQNIFKGDFEKLALKRRFPKLYENTEKLEKEINKSISQYRKSVSHWDNEQPCVRSHDSIRDKINDLFDGKVGDMPESQDWLDKLYADGQNRFSNKIPPGFGDTNKAKKDEGSHFDYDGLRYERQYGDLILWMQTIEKSTDENIKNVVFVTDDAKEDWWYKIDSNGKKVIGPLAELQAEIYSKSNIDLFHMYSTSMFMSDGKSYMSVVVDDSSIDDARVSNLSTKHLDDIDKNLTEAFSRRYRDDIDKNLTEVISRKYRDYFNTIPNAHEKIYQQLSKSIPNGFMENYNNLTSRQLDFYRELTERGSKSSLPIDKQYLTSLESFLEDKNNIEKILKYIDETGSDDEPKDNGGDD